VSKIKLNLGCGSKLRQGYVNADMVTGEGVSYADLTAPLPWGDGTASEILLEDVVEHLWPDELERLLVECERVLCVGGKLVLVTPDLGAVALAVVQGTVDLETLTHVMFGWYAHKGERERSIHMLHKQAWTRPEFEDLVEAAGFRVELVADTPQILADRVHPSPCLSMGLVATKQI